MKELAMVELSLETLTFTFDTILVNINLVKILVYLCS